MYFEQFLNGFFADPGAGLIPKGIPYSFNTFFDDIWLDIPDDDIPAAPFAPSILNL